MSIQTNQSSNWVIIYNKAHNKPPSTEHLKQILATTPSENVKFNIKQELTRRAIKKVKSRNNPTWDGLP